MVNFTFLLDKTCFNLKGILITFLSLFLIFYKINSEFLFDKTKIVDNIFLKYPGWLNFYTIITLYQIVTENGGFTHIESVPQANI